MKMPEPVGYRMRFRSEPGMIGNYPWTYGDARSRSKIERPEYEWEDLCTVEQMKQYGRDLLEAAINSYSPDDTAMDYINKLIDMKEKL